MSTGRSHRDPLRLRSFHWGASAFDWPLLSGPCALHRRPAVTAATVLLFALAIPTTSARAAACCSNPERFWQHCVVTNTTPDSIVVRVADDGMTRTFALKSMPLQNAAANLRRPNEALIVVGEVNGEKSLLALGVRVDWKLRLGVVLGVAGALLALGALLLSGGLRPLTIGEDGPYSGSKWQMVVWFSVLVVAYGATLVLRWWAGGVAYTGGVGIPAKLLILSGLSAFTFAAAKTIRQMKENRAEARRRVQRPAADVSPLEKEQEEGQAREKHKRKQKPRPRFPADLVRDEGGDPDLGNFQMIVVTILAVVVYVVRVFACLGQVELSCGTELPDVDTAILGAVGIGHAAYLAKKAVSPLKQR